MVVYILVIPWCTVCSIWDNLKHTFCECELIEKMFELNETFLMVMLCGLLSSSVSLMKEPVLAEGGAVIIFAFTFSACVWTFLLTSGMVFEGNISAIWKVLRLLGTEVRLKAHLFIGYIYDIAVIYFILSGRSCCKAFIICIGLVLVVHGGSLVFSGASGFERLCKVQLNSVSKLIKFLCSNSCS